MKQIIFIMTFLLSSSQVFALTLKVGVLAPEGTNWSNSLKKMGKEIKDATDGKVKLKIYFGGSQGDEPDVLRKIRVGQLHGGIFTGKTLGDIYGDVRVMEIPFTFFGDRDKAWKVLEGMTPYFNTGFEKNEFVNLGFFELGSVYFVSQKSTPNIDSLKGVKIWSWEGDKLVDSMISTLNLVSVPLPLPDVLSSLSTGIVHAAYAPPMGIIALQWNTKVKYLVDFPLSYSIGAFLVDKKTWSKIPKQYHQKITDISNRYVAQVNKANKKDNQDALAVMKSMGIQFLDFPKSDLERGKKLRSDIVKSLTGNLFSKKALQMFNDKVGM